MKKPILTSLFPVALLVLAAAMRPANAEVFNFTVPPANQPIPDGALPLGITDTRTPTTAINVIQDISITLNISPITAGDGWTGDLYAYVQHVTPGGAGFSVLLNRVGTTTLDRVGYSDQGFSVTFSDTAANGDIHLYQSNGSAYVASLSGGVLGGTWQPDGRNVDPNTVNVSSVTDLSPRTAMLTAGTNPFTGLSAKGDWTVFVADGSGGNAMQITSWTLDISGISGPFYWKGATDGLWTTIGSSGSPNWAADAAGTIAILATPDPTADVVFSATGAGNRTTTLGADFTIRSLTMSDTVGAVQINGANTLTIAGAAGTGIDVQAGAQALTIGANVTLGGSSDTITVNNAAGLTISGALGGTNGLNKLGTGTLTLSGTNTYTGNTFIDGGGLTVTGSVGNGTSTSELIVGLNNGGTNLTISGGGVVTNGKSTIGYNAASDNNTVLLTGAGSQWNTSSTFYLGWDGAGNTMTVSDGAKFTLSNTSNFDAVIGANAGSDNNKLTITGTGSSFSNVNAPNGSTLYVGRSGTGNEMDILAGGSVASFNARIGGGTGSVGTPDNSKVLVDGTGSLWTVGGTLRVGSNGTNSNLTISSGGVVNVTGNTFLGYDASSTGNTVLVTGTGSQWNVASLAVGRNGSGTVTVADSGVLSATSITLGLNAASSGTLQIGNGAGAGTVTGSGITSGAGTATVVFNHTDAAYTFAPLISGTTSVQHDGSGTTSLTAANTYTGTTAVNAGVLQVGDGTTGSISGSSAVAVASGAMLAINLASGGTFTNAVTDNGTVNTRFSGAGTNTLSGNISGTGGVLQSGTATSILSGNNGYTGTTVVNNGVLLAGSATAFGTNSSTTVTAPGVLDIGGFNITIGGLDGTGTVRNNGAAATLTLGGGDHSGTFTGAIQNGTGVLSLTKAGTGTQNLNGATTYTGTTTVNAGMLSVNTGGTLWTTGALVVNGGTLQFDNSFVSAASLSGPGGIVNLTAANGMADLAVGTDNSDTAFSGNITGTVLTSFRKVGAGTLTLNGNGNNAFAGVFNVDDGRVDLSMFATQATGQGPLNIGDGTGAAGSAVLKVIGSEQINDTSAVTIASDGKLDLNNVNEVIGSLAGSGSVTLGSGDLTAGGDNTTTAYAGVISGTGGLLKLGTGTMTLSGANTFTGLTSVVGGTLSLSGGSALADTDAVSVGVLGTLDLQNSETIGSLAGSGAVTLNANTLTTGGNNVGTVFNGVMSGSGGLVKEGIAVFTLSGANTSTGPVTVNGGILNLSGGAAIADSVAVTVNPAGTLTLQTNETIGSLAGSGATNLNQRTLTTGGNNASTSYSGAFSGSGGLVKNGTGTFTVSGTSSFTGGTTLNAGTLAVGSAKALGSGNLTVNAGTLRTTGGPIAVDIGAGNIQFNGGTYVANVGGTAPGVTHDQLKTTGTAAIGGGTLALVQQNGFVLGSGTKVVLLLATGGVVGGTAGGTALPAGSVTGLAAFSNSPLLVATVKLYTDSIVLEAVQGSFAGLQGTLGFTPNQIAVAGALDSLSSLTGGRTGVIAELDFLNSQPISTLAANLDKISPDELTVIFDISRSLSITQSNNLLQRLDALHGGGGGAGGSAFGISAGSIGGASYGPVGRQGKEAAPAPEDRWGLFMTGSGEFTRIGSTTNAAGYNYQTGGVTAGIDYRIHDHFALGLSLGYVGTNANLTNGGSVNVDGGRIGLYATYFDKGFYVDAAVSGGLNSYKTRRVTPNNTAATASPDGSEVDVLLATGYDWKVGSFTLGPVVTYQYTGTHLDGFTETGAFLPLSIRSASSESSRTTVGFRAVWDAQVAGKHVRPEVRASWQHEFGDVAHQLTSTFATLGGSPFTVTGPITGRDSLLVGAGVTIQWSDRVATYLNYDGEVGRKNYESHSVSGGFRIQF